MLIHGILAPFSSSKLERQNHHSISLPFTLPASPSPYLSKKSKHSNPNLQPPVLSSPSVLYKGDTESFFNLFLKAWDENNGKWAQFDLPFGFSTSIVKGRSQINACCLHFTWVLSKCFFFQYSHKIITYCKFPFDPFSNSSFVDSQN